MTTDYRNPPTVIPISACGGAENPIILGPGGGRGFCTAKPQLKSKENAMKKATVILAAAVLALAAICSLARAEEPGPTEMLRAEVESVHDVDTITARVQTSTCGWLIRRIRLGGGVDGPESKQAFGQVAAARTRELVKGTRVLVLVTGSSYGRLVGRVYVRVAPKTWRDLGLILAAEGLVWADPRYARGEYGDKLRAAIARAQAESLGLWSQPAPVAPWKWRKGKK